MEPPAEHVHKTSASGFAKSASINGADNLELQTDTSGIKVEPPAEHVHKTSASGSARRPVQEIDDLDEEEF